MTNSSTISECWKMKDTYTNQSSFASIMIAKLINDSNIFITCNQEMFSKHSIIFEYIWNATAKFMMSMSDSIRSASASHQSTSASWSQKSHVIKDSSNSLMMSELIQMQQDTSSEKIEFLDTNNIFDEQVWFIFELETYWQRQ